MEPKGYELLKIETKIDGLEKELSILFDDFRLAENKDTVDEKLKRFLDAKIKQITIPFPSEEFDIIVERLDRVMEKLDIEDYSKLIKYVLDSLSGQNGFFLDDNQVYTIYAEKLYSDKPRTEIIIIEEDEVKN